MAAQQSTIIITEEGLKEVNLSQLFPVFSITHFLPIYDQRTDTEIHAEPDSGTSVAAIWTSAAQSSADTHNDLFGEKLWDLRGQTSAYQLSDNSDFIYADPNSAVPSGTQVLGTSQNKSGRVNLIGGTKTLAPIISGTDPVADGLGDFNFSSTATYTTSADMSQINPDLSRDYLFSDVRYIPITSGSDDIKAIFKCVMPNTVGTFKFNKVALYISRLDANGNIQESISPKLFAVVSMDRTITKAKSGVDAQVQQFELDVELDFLINQSGGNNTLFYDTEYWTQVPLGSDPTSATIGLFYQNDVAIGTSAGADGSWNPRGKLHITDGTKSQLSMSRRYGVDQVDFTVTSAGYLDVGVSGTDRPLVSIGLDNELNGHDSVAIGENNVVDGDESLALGSNNSISGDWTLTQGNNQNSVGANNALLGSGHNVSGFGSLSVGLSNEISDGTNVSGVGYSVALGTLNTVRGTESLALGTSNVATGNRSYALGFSNLAQGAYSLATGEEVSAFSDYSFGSGKSNSVGSSFTLQFGLQTSSYNGNSYNLIGGNQNSVKSDFVIANGAGLTVRDGSTFAIVQGTNNDVKDALFTITQGQNQIVDIAEHGLVLGSSNSATGNFTSLHGSGNYILSGASVPQYTKIYGSGNDVSASDYSDTEGSNNFVTNSSYAHTYGEDNIVYGSNYNMTVGDSNWSRAPHTYQFGYLNRAHPQTTLGNVSSHAYVFGVNHQVYGYNSFVGGEDNIVRNGSTKSAVFGASNELISGDASLSVGFSNTIEESNGIVGGNDNSLEGKNSLIVGDTNTIYGFNSFSSGLRNRINASQAGSIGVDNFVGTTSTVPTDSDRTTGKNSFAIGELNTIQGSNSLTVGSTHTIDSTASQILTVGFNNTNSQSSNSLTVGQNNTVISSNAIVGGDSNLVYGANSFVFGDNNTLGVSTNLNSTIGGSNFVFGQGHTTSGSDSVYMGRNILDDQSQRSFFFNSGGDTGSRTLSATAGTVNTGLFVVHNASNASSSRAISPTQFSTYIVSDAIYLDVMNGILNIDNLPLSATGDPNGVWRDGTYLRIGP